MSSPALPRAVLFDWDSTLVDNWAGITSALNAALTAYGHAPWTEVLVKARAKKSARDSFPELFGDDWEAAMALFYRQFETDHVDKLRPMPGATDLLEALAGAGVPMGVVSNKNGDHLRAEAAHLGWTERFVRLVGATDAPRDKPAADPILMVLAAAGLPAGPDVWYVGDSLVDIECARAAGCRAILVETTTIEASDREKWPPDDAFPHCMALQAAIFD